MNIRKVIIGVCAVLLAMVLIAIPVVSAFISNAWFLLLFAPFMILFAAEMLCQTFDYIKMLELKERSRTMTENETLGLIKEFGELTSKLNLIKEKLSKIYPFDTLMDWGAKGIYAKCIIKNGALYDSNGGLLSKDGGCMDEDIPYFVNQYTGYCEDDYYGTMFIKVDEDNTFVAVEYWC